MAPETLVAAFLKGLRNGTDEITPGQSAQINSQFDAKQQAFLDFVLQHYVTEGVEELEQSKLNRLLRLKYHDSITDAVADLGGQPEEIAKAVLFLVADGDYITGQQINVNGGAFT